MTTLTQIGKYYKCPRWYLLVFPSEEMARKGLTYGNVTDGTTTRSRNLTESSMELYRYRYGDIKIAEPNTLFFVIDKKNCERFGTSKDLTGPTQMLFCLFPEYSGWIVNFDETILTPVEPEKVNANKA